MKKLFIFIFSLIPSLAFAAIANVGTIGTNSSITSGTSLVITTSAELNLNNVAILRIGSDNFGASDGNTNEHLSVVDSVGNTYNKICEYTYAEAGAGNAGTISAWIARASTALPTSSTITITFANAITSKAAQAQEFSVTSGNTLQIAGTCKTENINSADAGALTTDTLPSKEYIFYRAIAFEARADALSTPTTNYTVVTASVAADTGTNATSMQTMGERRIVTATSETSDPIMSSTSRDGASIFFALEECTPKVNCTGDIVSTVFRRPPIIVQ